MLGAPEKVAYNFKTLICLQECKQDYRVLPTVNDNLQTRIALDMVFKISL